MNREIKFRGKCIHTEVWITGYYLHDEISDKSYIAPNGNSFGENDLIGQEGLLRFIGWEVDLKTIGQYTGLKDKNGVEIYEGDIVEAWSQGTKAKGEVKQRIDGYWLMYPAWQSGESWTLSPDKEGNTTVEVIGNIHEVKDERT